MPPDDLAFVEHEDAVGEREDLLELERHEQDRAAFVAFGDEPPVEVFDRADVEAARWLSGDQRLRVAGDLACGDDLLLVPARQRSGRRERAAPSHVELLDQRLRALDEPLGEEPAPLRVGRLVVVVQRDVLGERELEDEAAALAVLGNVAQPRVEHLARRRVVELAAADAHDAARRAGQAGERFDQLGLAVAVDAGDADDLAGANLERHAAHFLDAAVVGHPQVLDLQQNVADLRRRLFDAQEDVAPDHGPGERLLGRPVALNGLDRLAATEDGDAVGDLEHLAELVGDEDDRDALAP